MLCFSVIVFLQTMIADKNKYKVKISRDKLLPKFMKIVWKPTVWIWLSLVLLCIRNWNNVCSDIFDLTNMRPFNKYKLFTQNVFFCWQHRFHDKHQPSWGLLHTKSHHNNNFLHDRTFCSSTIFRRQIQTNQA